MTDGDCRADAPEMALQRRVLIIALILNAVMFVAETGAGIVGHSAGLIADGIDMLSDAIAYAIALYAVSRSPRFKAKAAHVSGIVLMFIGIGVLADVARRAIYGGAPDGTAMIALATVAIIVNAYVLKQLARIKDDGVHIRATWIFTRADVVANAAVILSGVVVAMTGFRYIDLAVGGAIGLYVIREALEIFREAEEAEAAC